MTDVLRLVRDKALAKDVLTHEECLAVLAFPQDELLSLLQAAYDVRRRFVGSGVHVQMLMNAKSGLCSEDCHYCSQSCVSKADIEKYPLKAMDEIVAGARVAKQNGAKRFCMALSGIKYSDRVIGDLALAIARIKKETPISVCCSIGFLTEAQAEALKKAGLDRINHNLNTSQKNYPNICTSHQYEERVANIKRCQSKGLEICSGGIIGLGEDQDDVIQMLYALREINPESIPLNFLIPIKGTPFENGGRDLTPCYCLKVLCLARFLHPDKDIRVAGGREYRLGSLQPLALYPANSIFVSGYLTTGGQAADQAIQMIKDMGMAVDIEGADAC